MKESSLKNQYATINGIPKDEIESFVSANLTYPEFRVLIMYHELRRKVVLLIEVHVAELGEDSNWFSVFVEAESFPKNARTAEYILEPMIDRLDKDIAGELKKAA